MELEGAYGRHSVANQAERAVQKQQAHRKRGLTRDTRATVDGVLDPRTTRYLAKFKRAGFYTALYGCISTGKEANVYASSVRLNFEDECEKLEYYRAIKIFKTSILVFKNRHQYVEGDFRFRRGFVGSSNPRKMVQQWAEKEFRNLRRLNVSGIRAPIPIELRGHVLIMTLVGSDIDQVAPRLKDCGFTDTIMWKRLYIEALTMTRVLLQSCKLIHGDLSEYNILFYQGHLYLIDVSQSMESDHCHSQLFLKRDCLNLTRFFRSRILQRDSDVPFPSPRGQWEASDDEGEGVAEDDEKELDSAAEEDGFNVQYKHSDNAMPTIEPLTVSVEAEDLYRLDQSSSLLKQLNTSFADLLTVEEMYTFVTQTSDLPAPENEVTSWPDFDLEYQESQWRALFEGQRLRGNLPIVQKTRGAVSAATKEQEQESPGEVEIIKTIFAGGKQLSLEELRARRRWFAKECTRTLQHVIDTTSGRQHTSALEPQPEFFGTVPAASLHEVSQLIHTRIGHTPPLSHRSLT